jgi:hypothetical protein
MRKWVLVSTLLLLLPSFAFAAGFAKQSLFLSKSPVTEGDTVLIHAVVENDATTKFDGDVVFNDGANKLGSVAVSIAAGGAQAVSLSWKPAAGSHNITAKLTSTAGLVAETESATFNINEKPKPAAASLPTSTPAAVDSSQGIQQNIGNFSPQIQGLSAPLFNTVDGLRQTMASGLQAGIDWAKGIQAKNGSGNVLGDQTSNPQPKSIPDTLWGVGASAALSLFSILLYIVSNAGIFYPVLAVLFLFILWRLYKRFRRPRYSYEA